MLRYVAISANSREFALYRNKHVLPYTLEFWFLYVCFAAYFIMLRGSLPLNNSAAPLLGLSFVQTIGWRIAYADKTGMYFRKLRYVCRID